MPIENTVEPVDKSDPAFDLRTDIIFGGNSGAKVNKFLDCIKSIVIGRNLIVDSRSIALKAAVHVIKIRKQLDTFLKKSAIAMHSRLSQNTLHNEVEEIA